jgi:hypothetical protein
MNNLLNLNNICPNCALASLGTKLDTLNTNLNLETPTVYDGELLTSSQISGLNNMCSGANSIALGTYIESLLEASTNGTEVTVLTDAQAAILNQNVCGGFSNTSLGTSLQEWAGIINNMVPSASAQILTYSIAGEYATINEEYSTISLEVSTATDLTNLVATFTLSAGATATVGGVAQVSGTTANNFTNQLTYEITAQDTTTTRNYTVDVYKPV